ncbi:carbon-nitrogen hydrolase family protein [Paenibacillus silvisoli]|uniref:carbon-nitrogen hydrolase family protein n=1 Tax=Paenibacillus silvisoli TaxID=3110539 RepID=UPI0028045267|nr:carbon-nitrogen hydrolase family protein [Paenibacillus silvisoli]
MPNHASLIPSFSDQQWYSWSPRPELSPVFSRECINDESVLRAASNGSYNSFGYWKCAVTEIVGGAAYTFSFDYFTEQIHHEEMSVVAILTWQSETGVLTRDYIGERTELEAGWKQLKRTVDAPADALSVIVELGIRWTKEGAVKWRNPSVVQSRSIQHRKVKLATTYLQRHDDLTANLNAMLDVIDRAGKQQADIICLSEVYYDRGVSLPFDQIETVPGTLTDLIADKARANEAYVILCMKERERELLYVTAVLFDRQGNIAGKYRKVHIPLCEAEEGFSAGTEYPVFETDFGKIGILICFDLMFPEATRILVKAGAEMIFSPTLGDAQIRARARAADHGVHVIISGANEPQSSLIIDPLGEIIAEASDSSEGLCLADIDLDQRHYVYWLDVGPANGEPLYVYANQQRTDTYRIS